MIRTFTLVSSLLLVSLAGAEEPRCYQLASSPETWSRTPERMCLQSQDGRSFSISLRTGLGRGTDVAHFQMQLLNRARCTDCNRDELGIANPSNSVFNALAIRFDGKRDPSSGEEAGVVSIGQTRFVYRTMRGEGIAGGPPPPTGPQPPPAPMGPMPMAAPAFAKLVEAVKGSWNVDKATEMVRAAANNWFTAEQAAMLVHNFPAPSYRYEPALAVGRRVIDRANLHLLIAEMLGDDARKLREALK